jgi:hypothetical protein
LVWTIDYTDTARRALRKMDKHSARQIVEYLTDRIGAADDPHDFGKSLKGPLGSGPLKSTFAASKWQRYRSKMSAAGSHSACKGILL